MIRTIIENALNKNCISKRQFCIENGLNYSNFCAFLRGSKTISVSKVENVLNALNLSINETNNQLDVCDIEKNTYNKDNRFEYSNIDVIESNVYQIENAYLMGDAPKALIKIGGYKYLAKTGHKWYPIESITEYLLNKLGEIFGLNMAESRLAVINSQIRFLSKWFLSETQTLIHGAEIFSNYLNDNEFVSEIERQKMSRDLFTLQFVEKSIKHYTINHYDIMHDLVKLLLFDAFVGNNDRHYENWAIIVETIGDSKPAFSPVYDTARGLFWNQSEESLATFNYDKIKKYSTNSKPKLGWEGISDKDLNHFRLTEEIYKNQFFITKNEIEDLFSQDMIERAKRFVSDNFSNLMSARRIEVINQCLDFRFSTIKNLLK